MNSVVAITVLVFLGCVVQQSTQACLSPACKSCGNGKCEIGETSCTCPLDCPGCCQDGSCRSDRGETPLNCPADCAFSIQVQVVDAATGATIPGATVTCYTTETLLGPTLSTSASTVFPLQGEGAWTCTAERWDYFPGSNSAYLSPPAKCVPVPPIVIQLNYRYACLFGEVHDALTGIFLPNAKVACTGPSVVPPLVSDANGKWFALVVAGVYTCTASGVPGYYPATVTQTYAVDEKKPFRIFLPPLPAALTGRFVDSKNGTALFATVVCSDSLGNVYTFTGHNYSFTNIPYGPATCTATKYPYYPLTLSGVAVAGRALDFTFDLVEQNGNIDGVVIDGRTGLPISDALVECMSMWDMGMQLTNSHGGFLLTGLKKAPYMCMVTHCGYMPGWLTATVVLNSTVTLNYVLLPIESVVYGEIYAFDIVPGAPIANASVSCVTADGQRSSSISDANGNYRIGEFYGMGEISCIVQAVGFQTSSRTLPYMWQSVTNLNISMPVDGLSPLVPWSLVLSSTASSGPTAAPLGLNPPTPSPTTAPTQPVVPTHVT